MAKRIAPFAVVSCVLLAAFGVVSQSLCQSLPDTPLVQGLTSAPKPKVFVKEARSALKFGVMDGKAGLMRQGGFASLERPVSSQRESSNVFKQYLNSSVLKQQSGYHSSSSESLMGRATYAGSRIFLRRDEFGKSRLNTSYLLRALTSMAAATASRPYWRRSLGQPFGDLGSTVGNEAGMNLWHEFRPGIEQLMKSHTPRFVAKIKERIDHK
ncbi:MAG: hypothetical protein WB762_05370 [Candidatus Sulfotelmatobacter sp.]